MWVKLKRAIIAQQPCGNDGREFTTFRNTLVFSSVEAGKIVEHQDKVTTKIKNIIKLFI